MLEETENKAVESPEEEEKDPELPKKEYEFMEDLPGVGPATVAKLRELGFHTVESLAMATAREIEPAGVGEKKSVSNNRGGAFLDRYFLCPR